MGRLSLDRVSACMCHVCVYECPIAIIIIILLREENCIMSTVYLSDILSAYSEYSAYGDYEDSDSE